MALPTTWLRTSGATMPKYLPVPKHGVMAIAICDRCRRKVPYGELAPDGNSPGLRVCREGCSDQYDPYRLPTPQPEVISLQFPRPEQDLE